MRLRVQEVKRGQDDNNDTRGEKREERDEPKEQDEGDPFFTVSQGCRESRCRELGESGDC